MRSLFGRRAMATALLLVLAAGIYLLERLLAAKGMAWAGAFGSVAAFFLALAVFLVPAFVRWFRPPVLNSASNVPQATEDLASSVTRQLAEEEKLRRINDPRPLPVRWEVTSHAEAAMLEVGFETDDDILEEAWLREFAGRFDDIGSVFNRIPSRRLVILGPTGAGKSVLATKLASQLLATRQPGMPVPVILPAASWDPDSKLTDWIATQLTNDHPGLAMRTKTATGEVTSLAGSIASGGILPIIDGLDELPHRLRTKVITEVNAAGSQLPFVVTSRSEQYLTAIAESGRAISRAIAVEILPLRVQEVKTYLAEATAVVPPRRWLEVFDHLDTAPNGALASVLATPLMLWLARTVYDSGESDPSELIRYGASGDTQAIEHHLLDAFVPTVYTQRSRFARGRWTPQKAEHWLGFLADYLNKTGYPGIEWWRLTLSMRAWRPISTLIRWTLLFSIAWVLIARVLRWHGDWRNGAYYHHNSLLDLFLGGPLGQAVSPVIDQMLHALFSRGSIHAFRLRTGGVLGTVLGDSFTSLEVRGSILAVLLGVVAMANSSWPMQPKLTGGRFVRGMVNGLAAWIMLLFFAATIPVAAVSTLKLDEQRQIFSTLIRVLRDPWTKLFMILVLVSIFTFAVQHCISSLNVYDEMSPKSTIRLDRRATFLIEVPAKVAAIAFVYLWCGLSFAAASGVFLLSTILCRILFGGRKTASDLFTDCRIWLICGRLVPWRMMAFLDDAHQRGVLRRVGAVYQFRHIRLQQRLGAAYMSELHRWNALTEPAADILRPYAEKVGAYIDKADPESQRLRSKYGWEARRVGLTWIYRDPRFRRTDTASGPDENGDYPNQ